MVAIAEVAQGATDDQVLHRALTENRILITEDRDFGELVYRRGRSSAGVILLRFPAQTRRAKPATVLGAVTTLGSKLDGVFTVVQPGRVRISARPSSR